MCILPDVDIYLKDIPTRNTRRGVQNGDMANFGSFRVKRFLYQQWPLMFALGQYGFVCSLSLE
jgi:hypothetical protein